MIPCRFCHNPVDPDDQYRSVSARVNAAFHPDECNACRRDTEREMGGDNDHGFEEYAEVEGAAV